MSTDLLKDVEVGDRPSASNQNLVHRLLKREVVGEGVSAVPEGWVIAPPHRSRFLVEFGHPADETIENGTVINIDVCNEAGQLCSPAENLFVYGACDRSSLPFSTYGWDRNTTLCWVRLREPVMDGETRIQGVLIGMLPSAGGGAIVKVTAITPNITGVALTGFSGATPTWSAESLTLTHLGTGCVKVDDILPVYQLFNKNIITSVPSRLKG